MIPILNENKFSCGRCGCCCTNIKSAFSSSSKEQRLIFSLRDDKDIGLPLWEWEAQRLQKLAREKNIDATIEPLRFFYDKISKKSVIVSFHLDNDSCIFYEPGKCNIYEDRPFVCSMFPVVKSSVFDFVFSKKEIKIEKTLCGSDHGREIVKGEMNAPEYVKKMESYYGESFVFAVQNDIVKYLIVKKLKHMTDEGVIDPLISPRELALKRYESSEKMNFLDFLAEKGENREKLMKEFSDVSQARKLIDKLSG